MFLCVTIGVGGRCVRDCYDVKAQYIESYHIFVKDLVVATGMCNVCGKLCDFHFIYNGIYPGRFQSS